MDFYGTSIRWGPESARQSHRGAAFRLPSEVHSQSLGAAVRCETHESDDSGEAPNSPLRQRLPLRRVPRPRSLKPIRSCAHYQTSPPVGRREVRAPTFPPAVPAQYYGRSSAPANSLGAPQPANCHSEFVRLDRLCETSHSTLSSLFLAADSNKPKKYSARVREFHYCRPASSRYRELPGRRRPDPRAWDRPSCKWRSSP